jgi:glycosyltransferase involved in cell wall biosynthesis
VPPIKVTYFFRKPIASFHSIEMLFNTVVKYLDQSEAKKVYLPYNLNQTPLASLINCVFVRSKQGQVNHITGEIYYIALALRRENTILTIHDIDSLESVNKLKNLLLHLFWLYLPVKHARFVTVVSEYSKSKLLKATGIEADKVFVIPNIVPFTEADFKPKLQINKQEPVLLQIGTKPNKNLENLIEGIRNLPCKLLIIGKLTEEQLSMLTNAQIKFEQYVDLPYSEVKTIYYRADIVTFVSTYEGFGIPILEANALGRPVITSTTASMPEVAGAGALLVDPYNPEEIRGAIQKLLADDRFRNDLVAAGFQNAQRFKPEVVAAMYEDLYKMVSKESK